MKLAEYIASNKNVTKRSLAKQIVVDESTLYKYIARERLPRLDIAIKIYEATGGAVTYREMLIKPIDITEEIETLDEDLL